MKRTISIDVGDLVAGLGKKHMRGTTTYTNLALHPSMKGVQLNPMPAAGHLDPVNFFLGFAVVPSTLNTAGRVAASAGWLGADAKRARELNPDKKSDIEMWISVGSFVLNLGYQMLSGARSSFFAGSLLGQIPAVAGEVGDLVVGAIKQTTVAPTKAVPGISALTPGERDALSRSGVGSVITDETRFQRKMSEVGMDVSGHTSQMGSNITDMVRFQR